MPEVQRGTLPIASAHGRFQPLHSGHLEYLLAAKARCTFLWIGITQYEVDSPIEVSADDHRHLRRNNPLTYFERAEMLRDAMGDAGVASMAYGIGPFPIERPDALHQFLPVSVPIFTTIYDDWNRHKVAVLREAGYQVMVLWEREAKEHSGSEIRRLIVEGNPLWHELVPQATVQALESLHVAERLRP